MGVLFREEEEEEEQQQQQPPIDDTPREKIPEIDVEV
jgi:hypothetical protein